MEAQDESRLTIFAIVQAGLSTSKSRSWVALVVVVVVVEGCQGRRRGAYVHGDW